MNPEFFVDEQSWKEHINKIKSSVKPLDKDESFFISSIIDSLTDYLSKINERFTLLFSGGADSTLLAVLAKKAKRNFELLNVSFEDSEDLRFARRFAEKYGFEYREKILDENEVLSAIKVVSELFKDKEFVVKELACFEYLALKDSLNLVVSGTGAEEIFAGYQRHLLAEDVNEECWTGLENIFWQRDLYRVKVLSNITKRKVLLPFLDENLIRIAMSMPSEFKIKDNFRKYSIAKALQTLAIPEEYAFRKKKAAQYGSGLDKFFEKLAKKKGLKNKAELFGLL